MPKRRHMRTRKSGAPTRPQGDEQGFAIVEVMISFAILMIIFVPVALLFNTVIAMSANSRDRVTAANVASEEIAQARATDFTTLLDQEGSELDSSVKEGGITFSVAQTSSWVNESNVANACGGTGDGSAGTQPLLAITETVTWPSMGSTLPVISETDIAVPPSYQPSSLGSLAVSVQDTDGDGVTDATVTMLNTTDGTSKTVRTGRTGCAFEAYLTTGTYTITAQKSGYVDMNENTTATASGVALSAGDTVPVTLNYAPAAVVSIGFTSTAPQLPPPTTTTTLPPTTTTTVAGATTTTAATTTTTTLASTTTTLAVSPTVNYPTNGYPVTVCNACSAPRPSTITYSAPVSGPLQLWAYSNGYHIYPGGCTDNDPDGQNASGVYYYPALAAGYSPFSVSQGVESADTLQLYGLSITATSADGPVTNLAVKLTDTSGGCSSNNEFPFAAVSGDSTNIAIPLGTFQVSVTGSAGGHAVSGTIPSLYEDGSALAPQAVVLS